MRSAARQQWQLRLQGAGGESREVTARALVNAAGPWAAQFLAEHAHAPERKALRLVKGSHIVVRKLFEHDHAYIFQNPDKRIIFAIPYEGEFTLIGTTDVEHHGAIGAAHIDASEIDYLCEQASRYFERAVRPCDVVWSYSGVRPLLDDESGDPSAVTRDYALELDTGKRRPARRCCRCGAARSPPSASSPKKRPTCCARACCGTPRARRLDARRVPARRRPQRLDRQGAAPGHRLSCASCRRWRCATRCLPAPLCQRLARGYGSRVGKLLGAGALGAEVAPGLFEAELNYLHTHEWARTADDVLWRRTKLGLHLNAAERAAVAALVRGTLAARRRPTPGVADRGEGMELRLEAHRTAGRAAGAPVPAGPDAGAAGGDRAARRHAGRQDHADAPDGRPGQAQRRPACWPTART